MATKIAAAQNRLYKNQRQVYRLPNGNVELVNVDTYESVNAMFDIITRDNGEIIYQKNCRVITTIPESELKYFDFIRGK